jgi:drug/metabolite transporter (DMT)-like permease
MRTPDLARLLAVAAIWGASFIFTRVAVATLGAMPTAEARLALSGVARARYHAALGKPLAWRAHWRYYLALGTLNSAVPFSLYAWSALYLPASYLVVINATSPLFGALVAAAWLGEPVTARVAAGLAAGLAGVALLVGLGPLETTPVVLAASLAAACAAACYALGSAYVKRRAAGVEPPVLAAGTNIAAALAVLPLALAFPPPGPPTAAGLWSAAALGIVCTALAYVLYYRLVIDVGPARALTVTFLIPVFGMLWGALFLAEPITATMAAGCGLVLVGTALIVAPARAATGASRATR